jgi:hypothetical protein
MQIKYAGLKPVISQHGIFYKDGKEDKYIYLMAALEILQDIDNDYNVQKKYSRQITGKKLTETQIHTILQRYDKHLEDEVQQQIDIFKQHLEQTIKDIQKRDDLLNIEKETWCANLILMKDYQIQREINKIYYYHCINDIGNIILHRHIKLIQAPFTEQYWHVLQSIHGVIQNDKSSTNATIEEITQDNKMIIELKICY